MIRLVLYHPFAGGIYTENQFKLPLVGDIYRLPTADPRYPGFSGIK